MALHNAHQKNKDMALPKSTIRATSSSSSSNVHPLKPGASTVQPLEGWALESPFGHMAFEPGDGGRLIRLADVVKWLQSSREVSRSEAVELLCAALPDDVTSGLYWLAGKNQGKARLIPVDFSFGFETAKQIEARETKRQQNIADAALKRQIRSGRFGVGLNNSNEPIKTNYPTPTAPGLPALLKRLRGDWSLSKLAVSTCDILDDPKIGYATFLAIPINKAHALWGYGQSGEPLALPDIAGVEPSTWEELVQFRKLNLRAAWSAAQKAILVKEKNRRLAGPGAAGIAKDMAKELGLSVTLLNGLIRSANTPGKRQIVLSKFG